MPVATLDCVVGLGSNLGDRLQLLTLAGQRLRGLAPVLAVSTVYESAPLGPPQPDYLNAAVRLAWPSGPSELLAALLGIERSFGRQRVRRWGPRTLDLDLLWAEGVVLDLPDLTLPHPELTRRAFALRPLLDVAPDARDPRSGLPLALSEPALDAGTLRVVLPTWRV